MWWRRVFKKTPQIEEALYSSWTLTVVWLGTVWRVVVPVEDCASRPREIVVVQLSHCVKLVIPFAKDYFPKICPKLGGASVRFNNPCAWAHGQAQMTAAHFTNMCKGATRMIHWHTQADEWGFASWQMELWKRVCNGLFRWIQVWRRKSSDKQITVHSGARGAGTASNESWMNPYESVLDDGCKYVCPWMPWDVVCLCTLCT